VGEVHLMERLPMLALIAGARGARASSISVGMSPTRPVHLARIHGLQHMPLPVCVCVFPFCTLCAEALAIIRRKCTGVACQASEWLKPARAGEEGP